MAYPVYEPWTVVREIGSGSFGTVYEIERKDSFDVYKAALKVIHIPSGQNELEAIRSSGMSEASVSEYFQSEAEEIVKEIKMMARFKGITNIVSYEDHEVKRHDDGIGWDIMIRMELLTSLNKYLVDHPISRQDIIRLGIDICNALERCQKFNIIHRDIKPDNIFVSPQGDFKLGDFGIARIAEKTVSGMSRKGTPTYMAPEVYRGEPYGHTVDIYSLGILMYRLLNNNRVPFLPPYPQTIRYNDQEQAMVLRMSGRPLPPPSEETGRLAEIVLKACSFQPKDRYSSAARMREELEEIRISDKEIQDGVVPPSFTVPHELNPFGMSQNGSGALLPTGPAEEERRTPRTGVRPENPVKTAGEELSKKHTSGQPPEGSAAGWRSSESSSKGRQSLESSRTGEKPFEKQASLRQPEQPSAEGQGRKPGARPGGKRRKPAEVQEISGYSVSPFKKYLPIVAALVCVLGIGIGVAVTRRPKPAPENAAGKPAVAADAAGEAAAQKAAEDAAAQKAAEEAAAQKAAEEAAAQKAAEEAAVAQKVAEEAAAAQKAAEEAQKAAEEAAAAQKAAEEAAAAQKAAEEAAAAQKAAEEAAAAQKAAEEAAAQKAAEEAAAAQKAAEEAAAAQKAAEEAAAQKAAEEAAQKAAEEAAAAAQKAAEEAAARRRWTVSSLSFREAPDSNSRKVNDITIDSNAEVQLVDLEERADARGNVYAHIRYENQEGYVLAEKLAEYPLRWTTAKVNFRERPDSDSDSLSVLSINTEVELLDEAENRDADGNVFVHVRYDGREGYAALQYLTNDAQEASAAEARENAASARSNSSDGRTDDDDDDNYYAGNDDDDDDDGGGGGWVNVGFDNDNWEDAGFD